MPARSAPAVPCPPDARPPADYVERLRADVARARRAGEAGDVIRELVIGAYVYGHALTSYPGHLDKTLLLMARMERHERDGTSLKGRWQAGEEGYVYISPSGRSGRFSRELPAGVDPAAVVPMPEASVAVPGRQRVCAILQVLSTEADIPPSLANYVAQARIVAANALETTTPGRREETYQAWRSSVVESYMDGIGVGEADPGLTRLGGLLGVAVRATLDAYRSLQVDAVVVRNAIILWELYQAIIDLGNVDPTGKRESPADHIAGTGLGPVGSADGEAVLHALGAAWRDGLGQAIVMAAERIRDRADELIEAALDGGGALEFLVALHGAVPAALASSRLYAMLSELDTERTERWSRSATAAEEKHVRLLNAIARSVRLREEPLITEDRKMLEELRAEGGEVAVEDAVTQLIELEYLYPRSLRTALIEGRPF
jgi:hypothetical protein